MSVRFENFCVHTDERLINQWKPPYKDFDATDGSTRADGSVRQWAVSKDGKYLKKMLGSSYNDRICSNRGCLTIMYVCGMAEEKQRQRRLRSGDIVHFHIIDRRAGKFALLETAFQGIVALDEVSGTGQTLRTQHSELKVLRMLGVEGYMVDVAQRDAAHAAREAPPSEFAAPTTAQHMVFDTESAPPRDSSNGPHPVLQVSFVRAWKTLDIVVEASTRLLQYPAGVATGNDATSSVLKFPLDVMRLGEDAGRVLAEFFSSLKCVCDTGGLVIAHNVRHDLRQLVCSARAVGAEIPDLHLRCIDTVRVAANFVDLPDKKKWPTLAQLVAAQKMSVSSYRFHTADEDTRALKDVVSQWPIAELYHFAEHLTLRGPL